jgi:hypothetical protein
MYPPLVDAARGDALEDAGDYVRRTQLARAQAGTERLQV